MMELTLNPWPRKDRSFHGRELSYLKAHCKTEFKDVLDQVKSYRQTHQVSDEALHFLYKSLVTYYVGCLLEAEFDAKMTEWSNRLFGHWLDY